jgi:hypothetical protein
MDSAKSNPRRPFTDQYLSEYADEHVCYEVEHFLWVGGRP